MKISVKTNRYNLYSKNIIEKKKLYHKPNITWLGDYNDRPYLFCLKIGQTIQNKLLKNVNKIFIHFNVFIERQSIVLFRQIKYILLNHFEK